MKASIIWYTKCYSENLNLHPSIRLSCVYWFSSLFLKLIPILRLFFFYLLVPFEDLVYY